MGCPVLNDLLFDGLPNQIAVLLESIKFSIGNFSIFHRVVNKSFHFRRFGGPFFDEDVLGAIDFEDPPKGETNPQWNNDEQNGS